MKSLRPLLDLWSLAYLRWALREMPPDHPDLPYVVVQLAKLEDRRGCKTY